MTSTPILEKSYYLYEELVNICNTYGECPKNIDHRLMMIALDMVTIYSRACDGCGASVESMKGPSECYKCRVDGYCL